MAAGTGWADYVLKPDCQIQPLSAVKTCINERRRLPRLPSEAEFQKDGIGPADIRGKLLARVEGLKLHAIRAEEWSDGLEQQNRELRARIAKLEAAVQAK